MAPSLKDSVTSETMRLGSIFCSVPSPSQTGQAPNGLLNENSRGSISGMVKPEIGSANFSEKISRLAVPSSFAATSQPGWRIRWRPA